MLYEPTLTRIRLELLSAHHCLRAPSLDAPVAAQIVADSRQLPQNVIPLRSGVNSKFEEEQVLEIMRRQRSKFNRYTRFLRGERSPFLNLPPGALVVALSFCDGRTLKEIHDCALENWNRVFKHLHAEFLNPLPEDLSVARFVKTAGFVNCDPNLIRHIPENLTELACDGKNSILGTMFRNLVGVTKLKFMRRILVDLTHMPLQSLTTVEILPRIPPSVRHLDISNLQENPFSAPQPGIRTMRLDAKEELSICIDLSLFPGLETLRISGIRILNLDRATELTRLEVARSDFDFLALPPKLRVFDVVDDVNNVEARRQQFNTRHSDISDSEWEYSFPHPPN